MADKPKHASEYDGQQAALVRATCLYVATKLGDLMDELVVVGGLVPSLIVDQEAGGGVELHVGTMDLDVGLALGLLDAGRYKTLAERLRGAGFEMDVNDGGNATRQRWTIVGGKVGVDFLIPPSLPKDRGGRLRDLERDFAAIIAPGLELAFRDRRRLTIDGTTILGEKASREVWVCDAGAYVVLKALAFDSRGENKDAYDLFYVVRNYGADVAAVAEKLAPLMGEPDAKKAISILRRDFLDVDAVGPRRVADFVHRRPDADLQADVRSFIERLLALL